MILSTILNFARAQAQTDSNGLTDANGLIWANEALEDFHRRLVDKGVDASAVQEAYADGTANQGTYLFPSDMLFLKALELDYTGGGGNNYRTAVQVDVANVPGKFSFDYLRKNADPINPQFDSHGDWFEIFPTPTAANNVTQLIRMFYFLLPTQYATTSDAVAYPENLDQTILGWRIAADYLYSIGDVAKGDAFNQKYEERVNQYIGTLSRGSQQPLQAQPIWLSGFEF